MRSSTIKVRVTKSKLLFLIPIMLRIQVVYENENCHWDEVKRYAKKVDPGRDAATTKRDTVA